MKLRNIIVMHEPWMQCISINVICEDKRVISIRVDSHVDIQGLALALHSLSDELTQYWQSCLTTGQV